MPPGSKRRKAAARKKKEQETTTHNTTSSSTDNNNNSNISGNNDLKSQDERESDGGEVNSPASQENHDQQHPFKEESEELEKRDPSPVRTLVSENKSVEEVTGDVEHAVKVEIEYDSAIKTERQLKSEEDSESQIVDIKLEKSNGDVEHARKVEIEDDGAIKTERELKSEEDLESQIVDVKLKESNDRSSSSSSSSDDESQVGEKKTEEVAYSSVSESLSLSEENKPVESAYASISEAILHDGENKPDESLPEEVIKITEEASFKEVDKSVVDAVTTVNSAEPLSIVTEEAISVAQSDIIESSLVPDAVETGLKETDESKRSVDKVFPISEDNVGAPSTVVECTANGKESKVSPTSEPPIAETSHGTENIRDSKIPDSSENQPLIGSTPRASERTFWMSCCGLLDVLSGSSR